MLQEELALAKELADEAEAAQLGHPFDLFLSHAACA